MSFINYIYKKIIILKDKKIFFLLLLLTFHFYNYNNNNKVLFNIICQIVIQLFFFVKIKSIKNKTFLFLLFFIIFTILILYTGVKWILYNLKK